METILPTQSEKGNLINGKFLGHGMTGTDENSTLTLGGMCSKGVLYGYCGNCFELE